MCRHQAAPIGDLLPDCGARQGVSSELDGSVCNCMKLAGTCVELVKATMAGMRSIAKKLLTVYSFHSLYYSNPPVPTCVQSIVEVPSGWCMAIISAEAM